MNKGLYKIASVFAILIGIIFILNFAFIWTILAAIILFYTGSFFWKLGKGKINENKLIKSSLILAIIGIVFFVLAGILTIICLVSSGDAMCLLGMLLGLFPFLVLYGIAVLLLIINWFKSR